MKNKKLLIPLFVLTFMFSILSAIPVYAEPLFDINENFEGFDEFKFRNPVSFISHGLEYSMIDKNDNLCKATDPNHYVVISRNAPYELINNKSLFCRIGPNNKLVVKPLKGKFYVDSINVSITNTESVNVHFYDDMGQITSQHISQHYYKIIGPNKNITKIVFESSNRGIILLDNFRFKTETSPTYTVKLNKEYGSDAPYLSDIKYGSIIAEPPAPSEADYIFEGWYKDWTYTQKWNFNIDTVTEDVTLYAKLRYMPIRPNPFNISHPTIIKPSKNKGILKDFISTIISTDKKQVTLKEPTLIGNTITANVGEWIANSDNLSYSYQWQRDDDIFCTDCSDGTDVPGATNDSYTLSPADRGKYIRVKVTCTNNNTGLGAPLSTSAYSGWIEVFSPSDFVNRFSKILRVLTTLNSNE